MVILYVETHFLMSIAKGQDPQAYTLLQNTPSSVRIVIPSICCMEAFSRLENEQKYRQHFEEELDKQINESGRDQTSPHAEFFRSNLEQSRIGNQLLFNDIEARLFDTLDQLAIKLEMIALTADILQQSLRTVLIEKELTDNLILHSVLHHARFHFTEIKVFLSGNTRDFGERQTEVQGALHEVGVNNYFSRTQAFLGWLQSQSA